MLELDRYALVMTEQFQREALQHFSAYEFHPVVAKLQTFCSEDLGAFYLDILKDRLYTTGEDSLSRRSAQTALWHITASLVRLMAPFLSFTAEEAQAMFKPGSSTIFTETYHVFPALRDANLLLAKWNQIREVRAEVLKAIETLRADGKVGSSLQAEVDLTVSGEAYQILRSLGDDLKFITITSRCTLHEGDFSVQVQASTHKKCERCWHYRDDVGSHDEHPEICGRCVSNLFGAGEKRTIA
jgi:isoleucyl-tRNA synthetase